VRRRGQPPIGGREKGIEMSVNEIVGCRSTDFTTLRYVTKPEGGAYSRLAFGLDSHNGERESRIVVRGSIEAGDMPAQLRWLADEIERHYGKSDRPPVYAYCIRSSQ
jgi:hypothetical protein